MTPVRTLLRGSCIWLMLTGWLPACATAPPGQPGIYYSVPAVSYLRACPDKDCPVVSEIYLSDRVRLLESRPTGWWRVESLRDNSVGWIQRALLREGPLPGQTHYVAVTRTPLRDTPHPEAASRMDLSFGDRVQKLTERQEWWRVLAEKDRTIGWVLAAHLTETLPEKPAGSLGTSPALPAPGPGPAVISLYVAAETAALRQLPLKDSPVVKRLRLNDRVEAIAHSGPRWRKVRFPETGAEGWVESALLREAPVTSRGQIVPRPKKPEKRPAPATKVPEPAPEPEAM